MYAVRRWSVRHARLLETLYAVFETLLEALHPVFRRIGYRRLARPVAAVEALVKRFLFDCRMSGAWAWRPLRRFGRLKGSPACT